MTTPLFAPIAADLRRVERIAKQIHRLDKYNVKLSVMAIEHAIENEYFAVALCEQNIAANDRLIAHLRAGETR